MKGFVGYVIHVVCTSMFGNEYLFSIVIIYQWSFNG